MKKIKSNIGMTLIEVLIALAILATGVIVLVKFQGDLLRNVSQSQQQSEAMVIAEGKMDELRNYSVIETTGGATAYDDISSGTSSVVGNNVTYTLTWTVTNVSSPPHKSIRVTVSWTDSGNKSESITLDSIVSPSDPAKSGEYMKGL